MVFLGGMYMFVMCRCLCCVKLIFMVCISVFSVFMLLGVFMGVYDIPSCMYVISPPPCLCGLSVPMLL